MLNLCAPAIIYLFFSGTQIIIDIYKKLYNTAFIKFIIMIMVTILLNILCQRGLGVISWIIVFIPFIMMTVIVSLLLYYFGLNSTTGYINHTKQLPSYTLMEPDTQNNNNYNTNSQINTTSPAPPLGWSSSPAYQSM